MKRVRYPSGRQMKLRVSSFDAGLGGKDENVLPIKYAYETYNFFVTGGNLKESAGFSDFLSNFCENDFIVRFKEKFEALGKILGVWHFRKYNHKTNKNDDKLIFINEKLQSYYININKTNTAFNRVYSLAFTSLPVAVNYRLDGEDVIIFSSPTDNMVVWDGENTAYTVLDAPKISSMALHYERLFATVNGEKNSVWFSDDLDPTNWSVSLDEAGFIQMIDERGEALKVVSFNDYLYVFRKQGISRITAYASQENFQVSHLFVSSSLIYENTVCVCGNRILFLAADGLYRFDGYDTVKILSFLDDRFSASGNEKACACFYNGKYYLSCKFDFEDENSPLSNNCLLEIDVDKLSLSIIRAGNITFLSSIVSDNFKGVLACMPQSENTLAMLDNTGTLFGKPLDKFWRSPFTDLGLPSQRKVIRKLSLTTKDDIKLNIVSDKDCVTVTFVGSISPQTKDVFITGKNFKFEILSSTAKAEVSNMEILIKVESD